MHISGGRARVQDTPSGRAIALTIDGQHHQIIQVKVQSTPEELAAVSVKKLDANGNEVGDIFDAAYWGAVEDVGQDGDAPYINPTPAIDDVLNALVLYEGMDDEEVVILPKLPQCSDDKNVFGRLTVALDSSGRVRLAKIHDNAFNYPPLWDARLVALCGGGYDLEVKTIDYVIDKYGRAAQVGNITEWLPAPIH